MRSIYDMDTVQIEITNACINFCSNCTRFCGHQKPYFMDMEVFKRAVASMVDYPKMTGIMGGEPLLHPQFPEFCEYILSKIPRQQLGLWSCFPPGYEHYREIICRTFGNIFLNDHSRSDIYHAPVLVASEEVVPDREGMFYVVDHCWLQNSWSASINPKGAFFCEIAAAMSLLFDGNSSWPVDPGWWWKTPKDFKEQIEEYCPKCGCAISLKRRSSLEGIDDISPGNLKRLQGRSLKIKQGKYVVSDLQPTPCPEPMAAYKDVDFRARIADRYGIFLVLNEKGFQEPYLKKSAGKAKEKKTLFELYAEKESKCAGF
jgi:hypothetical protein